MDNRVNLLFRYQDDPTKPCTTTKDHNDKTTAYDSAQLVLHIHLL